MYTVSPKNQTLTAADFLETVYNVHASIEAITFQYLMDSMQTNNKVTNVTFICHCQPSFTKDING